MPQTLLYAISNIALYRALAASHKDEFPGGSFAFLGSTFGEDAPCSATELPTLLPTSRLLLRWVSMNEMTERKIVPALRSGNYDAVFVHEYGREAYHFAVRYGYCPQTLGFHEGLVKSRILSQGGMAPTSYLSRPPLEEHLKAADAEYFKSQAQRITYVTNAVEMIAFLKEDIPAQQRRAQAA